MVQRSTERLPTYLDECVNHRIVPYLRQHRFTVTTARDEGMLGATDEEQLTFAAARSLVLLSYNRGHFARLHETFRRQGRPHAGIVLVRPARVSALGPRVAMLVDWLATFDDPRSQLVRWAHLQPLLAAGFRLPGYDEDDVRRALGREA